MANLVLVTGATGHQGGAVAKKLMDAGVPVRAMTRKASSEKAQRLKAQGAQVVTGDFDDPFSITAALNGVHTVFSVQNYFTAGAAKEVEYGKLLADLARKEGVSHFIYSSVCGAERESGVPHFETKWEIEKHIKQLGLPATIFRPAFFMENFFEYGFIQPKKFSMPLRPNTQLQMIAVEDIGAFVLMAIKRADVFKGQALEIAGDQLSAAEIMQVFMRVLGKSLLYEEQSVEELKQSNLDMGLMFQWFIEKGGKANVLALQQLHPKLINLEEFLVLDASSRIS